MEDEPDIRDIIKLLFEMTDWKVAVASNGQAALDLLPDFAPHVILSDIQMPVMDGMKLLEELDKKDSTIPVIFLSAFRDTEKMKRAWGLCAFDFIDKPYNEKNLFQVVQNAFDYGVDYSISARKRYRKLEDKP